MFFEAFYLFPQLEKLCDEFGIKRYKLYNQGKNVQYMNGVRGEYTGTIPPLNLLGLIDTHLAIGKAEAVAKTINLQEPWNSENAVGFNE
jgi:monoamine oxidase